jgi:hypothetical protein
MFSGKRGSYENVAQYKLFSNREGSSGTPEMGMIRLVYYQDFPFPLSMLPERSNVEN